MAENWLDKHSSEASLSTIQVIVVRINRLWAAAQTIHEDSKAGRNSGQDLRRQQCLENVKLDCIIPEMSSRSGLLLPTNHNNTAKTISSSLVDFLENPWTFSLVVRSTNVLTLAHVERIFSSKIARITIFVLGTINESLPGTGTPRGKDCLVEQWCTPIKRTLGPLLLEEVGKRKKGIERMEYRNRPSIKGPTTCRGSLPL